MPTEQEMRKHRCCFSGHRPEKLSQSPSEVQGWLAEQISDAVDEGFVTFITGMAMGVDIWAGEIVLRLRETDTRIHLIAAVPWPGFAARWNEEWKKRYYELLHKADLVRYISRNYDPSVFSRRNIWMVDHSAKVIAYYNGAEGGTKETLVYAKSQGIGIVVGGNTDDQVADNDSSEEAAEFPERASREYPLNLLDALLNCDAYRGAEPVQVENIPKDFDARITAAASMIKDDRAYRFLTARFRDGNTLQVIADEAGISRERVRQLIEKYIKRLRHPDVLRFLDCGIKTIPDRSSAAMVERLENSLKETGSFQTAEDP